MPIFINRTFFIMKESLCKSKIFIFANLNHYLILQSIENKFKYSKMNDKINIENSQVNNPLHGIRLIDILEFLVEEYGWEELGYEININCFTNNPSIKSSLKFLRKTQWARDKVEQLYLNTIKK